MIQFDEQYLVDEQGNRKAVVTPISSWQQVLKALDGRDDICAFDKSKRLRSNPLSFERAISDSKEGKPDRDTTC